MNAYQTPGIKLGALHTKNKRMTIQLSGIQKTKVGQGHIPITDKDLNGTETSLC